MDFLKDLALSQGIEHYHLLVFMAAVCSVVFFPYILFVFGSSIVSLWYALRAKKTGDSNADAIAGTIIADAIPSKGVAVFLGILPGLSLILIYAQMLQASPAISVSLAATGFIFLVIGFSLLYSFRHLSSLQSIFQSYQSLIGHSDSNKNDKGVQYQSSETVSQRYRAGSYGVLFLFLAIFFYISSWSLLRNPDDWGKIESVLDVLLTLDVWLKLIIFFAVSFGVTGAGILYFHQLRNTQTSSLNGALQNLARKLTIVPFIVVPVFLYFMLVNTPAPAISGTAFLLCGIALMLFFSSANFLYQNFREHKFATVALGALCFLLGSQFLVIGDHVGIAAATRAHSEVLAVADDKVFEELNKEVGVAPPAMTGEEIYQAKCSACHLFGEKKVGPPYNQVLPKYVSARDKMKAFIMNPVKINPDYPAMPNQGLKPSEADSIITYLLDKLQHPAKK